MAVVALPASGAQAMGGPSIKAVPHKPLAPGQVISLIGKGLSSSDTEVAECAPGAITVSSCDPATEQPATVSSKGHLLSPTSWTVTGPSSGKCTSPALAKEVTCEIGVVNSSGSVVALTPIDFPVYYLSLGDSYSVGYQPDPTTGGTGAASSGYTAVVAAKEKMTLENFGCGGATTASILTFDESQCGISEYGPPAATNAGPVIAGDTQLQDAEAFIAANPGQVGLITVSIGGNDVTPCAAATVANPVNGETNPIDCVEAGLAPIEGNVETLVGTLQGALAANDASETTSPVPIVGLTYPDVLLGLWVNSGPSGDPADTPAYPASTANQELAEESVIAFGGSSALDIEGLNPALDTAYTSVPGGKFVDITTDTDAYVSLSSEKNDDLSALGLGTIKIPKSVAEICKLTWYCQYGNIHANALGYTTIGKLVLKAL